MLNNMDRQFLIEAAKAGSKTACDAMDREVQRIEKAEDAAAKLRGDVVGNVESGEAKP